MPLQVYKWKADLGSGVTGWLRGATKIPHGIPVSGVLAAGSLPIGTADYTIPTSVVFYVSTGGSNGAAGTLVAPWATLAYAISNATSGDTIVVRGGSYHESVSIPSGKDVTIQSYPNEAVWFDGSIIVSGSWTNNGNGTWTTAYTVTWDRTMDGNYTRFSGDPLRNLVDQVFIDGIAQTQVADGTTPDSGQFSVNQTANTLTVATNPSGKTIRYSDLSQFLICSGKVSLLGIGVRRYSPEMIEFLNSMVYLGGLSGGSFFENCVFQESGMSAMNLTRTDITVRLCTIQDMGYTGVFASKTHRLLFEQNTIRRYNRGFWQAEPACAGIKFFIADQAVVRNNHVEDGPVCYGIWTDTAVTRFICTNNTVIGAGIQPMKQCIELEASDGGKFGGIQSWSYVIGNRCSGASAAGLLLYDSGWVKAWNNDVRDNPIGIQIWQDSRQNDGSKVVSGELTVEESPWHAVNNQVCNNMFAPPISAGGLKLQLIAYDDGLDIFKGWEQVTFIDGNWFTTSPPGSMVQLGEIAGNRLSYNTLAALALSDARVGGPPGSKLGTNYVGTTAPANSMASTMPADVASAIGVAAGTQIVGPPLAASIVMEN